MIGPFPPNSIAHGHALELARRLPDNSIDAIITSPPYWGLRDYSTTPVLWPAVTFAPMAGLPPVTIPEQEASLGLEADLWAYVGHLVALFRELRRGLKGTGSCWLNLGDSYAGSWGNYGAREGKQRGRTSERWERAAYEDADKGYKDKPPTANPGPGLKPKDLMLIPHRVALALQADGWYLRSDPPWLKRNAMPGSQQDRPTVAKEYWFLLSKAERYYFDLESIRVPGKEHKGQAGTFARNGSKNTSLEVPGQSHVSHRPDRDDRVQAGRSRRDSDWFFDSLRAILDDNAQMLLTSDACEGAEGASPEGDPLALTVNPVGYKGSHFAVFPPALVTPLVLASTSERGCCPEPGCGKPWVRVVEREAMVIRRSARAAQMGEFGRTQASGTMVKPPTSTTTGWQPTCAHDLEPIPAVILDPFMGSGTVGKEAARNRRRYLGFELNESYLGLAEDRATVQVEMF